MISQKLTSRFAENFAKRLSGNEPPYNCFSNLSTLLVIKFGRMKMTSYICIVKEIALRGASLKETETSGTGTTSYRGLGKYTKNGYIFSFADKIGGSA